MRATTSFSFSPSGRRAGALALGALLSAALMACGDKQQPAAASAAPPPEVAVVTVRPGTVVLSTELPGRLEPTRVAQVRARAAGIVQKRLFREGSDVKAGQALFAIDAAPYQASLQSAQATLAQAQSTLANASGVVTRYRPLVAANAVSKQEFDAAVAAEKAAQAQVAAGRAAVQTARINLNYATVTAPISGRIGRSSVTRGALVTASQATPLAVIQTLDPMYVEVSQSSAELLQLRREIAAGSLQGTDEVPVNITLEDGSAYPQQGKLSFAEAMVDPATGAVALRVVVPNPDQLLLPGMFVRATIANARRQDAILAPQQGITRNAKGDATAMVVGADGKVAQREVVVSRAIGNKWLVESGLKAGDKLIIEGLQKIAPGAPVNATEASSQAAKPATAAAPAKPAAAQ